VGLGWLVNDCLTCIPGTTTLWHNLLDWIPGLEDKTGVPYGRLADHIEHSIIVGGPPDYIIRNASYFRPLRTNIRTIALVQDPPSAPWQKDVVASADVVVAPSEFMAACYSRQIQVIPIPAAKEFRHLGLQSNNEVLFVGADTEIKGWRHVLSLAKEFPVRVVTKGQDARWGGFVGVHSRIKPDQLCELMNRAGCLIVPSRWESFHLAGAEAEACGLPIVATPVGRYWERQAGAWGCVGPVTAFPELIPVALKLPRTPYRTTEAAVARSWLGLVGQKSGRDGTPQDAPAKPS
jgi:glycosyltransferase involved in cell wall biosynthesis